ncbi:hypothetical protein E5F05_15495 [Deinococcus metallilatus]|uniref:Lipoprotein n=1 Tax=Deinococcus metallilatus TaxID=1211322 RepID=A0AAJ5JZ97_9DEIO|nr:hypothetical protein [Deinococcus metallilatus]MBB5296685.1 hypothetical protein [Deinococcus metallilatus]QBY09230.1 hypothetical protein E5F05_15495 [Deinococcus metallilatus]RXJ09750.1 hypothetical protein ERJ73_14325 [Deinococcus metallilatus]TLK24215.1 hypothetical protein FCS05_15285 [Deinococcus metallilatus]GMA13717.1 hypothetical protein GCM10025871_00480 [Deinococcus metallilatus]
MARFPLACLFLLTLSACTLSPSRSTPFAAGQNWLAQGYDNGQLTSAEVATGRFSTYDMDRSDVPAGSEKASVKVRSNLNPVMTLRLLFPGGTPMIVQTLSTGETDFLWNAGMAGAIYRCRVLARDAGITYISGDFVRVDQGKEVPLGSCGVRQR